MAFGKKFTPRYSSNYFNGSSATGGDRRRQAMREDGLADDRADDVTDARTALCDKLYGRNR
jgi:hypothetical protein